MHHGKTTCIGSSIVRVPGKYLVAHPGFWGKDFDLRRALERPGVQMVVVDVYATWCEPCMKAMPRWRKLREAYRDRGFGS